MHRFLFHASTMAACWALLAAGCAKTPLPQHAPEQLDRAHAHAIAADGALQAAALAKLPAPVDWQNQLFPAPQTLLAAPGAAPQSAGFSSQAQMLDFLSTFTAPQNLQWEMRRVGTSQLLRPIVGVFIEAKKTAENASKNAPENTKNNPPNSTPHLEKTQKNNPTPLRMLIVAGQQGNASASTEAALEFLHRLHQGKESWTAAVASGAVALIVVPRANPDGFAAAQPQTADGVDLSADYLTLRSAEAQTIAALIASHRPDVVVDLGEFAAQELASPMLGGALVQDIGLSYAAPALVHDFIARAAHEWWEQPTLARLDELGWRTGAAAGLVAQDGTAYLEGESLSAASLAGSAALRGMVGLRLQSRGSDLGEQHVARRTLSLAQALGVLVDQSAQRARDWAQLRQFVERETRAQACEGTLTLTQPPRLHRVRVNVLPPDAVELAERTLVLRSQAARFAADAQPDEENNKENQKDTLPKAHIQRERPCGYWLAAGNTQAAQTLQRLGLQVQQVAHSQAAQVLQSYLPPHSAGAAMAVQRSLVDIEAGSWYVPMHQPWSPLAAAALEADAPQGFFATGQVPALQDVGRFVNLPKLVFEGD